jgi:hypothetical protein
MTVGKKINRIGHHVVEIDANMRKLAKDRGGKAEFRAKEIACALMDGSHLSKTTELNSERMPRDVQHLTWS